MEKKVIIHPILFAILPFLFLISYNIGQVLVVQTVLPLMITLFLASLIWISLSLILKDGKKAGLTTSFFLLLFFSYGHFYDILFNNTNIFPFFIGSITVGPNKLLFPLWSISLFFGTYFIIKTYKNLDYLTRVLNIAVATAVSISLFNIGTYNFKVRLNSPNVKNLETIESGLPAADKIKMATLPDIYYIILDSYASAGTLKENFGYDNSKFIDYLTGKGFYVADKSCSNYSFTFLSIASSLNMEYLNNYTSAHLSYPEDRTIPHAMIVKNKVAALLKKMGYKYIFIDGGWSPPFPGKYADITIDRKGWSNEFSRLLINTTILRVFMKRAISEDLRETILSAFSNILMVHRKIKEPKFVYVHIYIPHGPFLFGPNGEVTSYPPDLADNPSYGDLRPFREPYLNQIAFANKKVKELVDEMLPETGDKPIIIIQADHGPDINTYGWGKIDEKFIRQRMQILDAYYLPHGGKEFLYDSISPVNSFRVIFKHYFGMDYDLLEDKSYFSSNEREYDLKDVTDMVRYK